MKHSDTSKRKPSLKNYQMIEGDKQGNVLKGQSSQDQIYGYSGHDTIRGGLGHDYIHGGKGYDTIKDRHGDELYQFNFDDEQDLISDKQGYDKVLFGQGIKHSNVKFVENELGDLVILLVDNKTRMTGDQLTISQAFTRDNQRIEEFVFEKDATLLWDDVIEMTQQQDMAALSVETIKMRSMPASPLGQVKEGTDQTDILQGTPYPDELKGLAGHDLIHGFHGDDKLYGGAGDDVIEANYGNNLIHGGEGNDVLIIGYGHNHISGDAGNDIIRIRNTPEIQKFYRNFIVGGLGQDLMESGYSRDTYLFHAGDGVDTIEDTGGIDQIIFGEGIAPEHLQVTLTKKPSRSSSWAYYSLLLQLKNDDAISILLMRLRKERLHKMNFQKWILNQRHKIEQVVFHTGEILTWSDLIQRSQSIYGTEKDDVLVGHMGATQFFSGKGQDHIQARGVKNRFHFDRGDGHLVIQGQGTIELGQGILPEHIRIVKPLVKGALQEQHAMLRLLVMDPHGNDIGDLIQLKTFYQKGSPRTLRFANGAEQDLSFIWRTGIRMLGTTGSDHIEVVEPESFVKSCNYSLLGGKGDDALVGALYGHNIFNGGQGRDHLQGGYERDTYIFNRGDGVDEINEKSGKNDIYFGQGILPEHITLERFQSDLYIYYHPEAVEQDKIIVHQFFDSEDYFIDHFYFSNDTLIQFNLSAPNLLTIEGSADNDYLYGHHLDETLIGGKGQDHLFGGKGNDTYLYHQGDGKDVIYDQGDTLSSRDRILFGQDISVDQVSQELRGASITLYVGKKEEGNQIYIQSALEPDGVIEIVEFADGTSVSPLELPEYDEKYTGLTQAMSSFEKKVVQDAPLSLGTQTVLPAFTPQHMYIDH